MTTATVTTHVWIDQNGTAWIDDTQIKVIEVVLDWLAHRSSAEEMHLQYPHLSVAQIHAALAFYHDQKADFDNAIDQDTAYATKLAAASDDSPGLRKLRAKGLIR